MTPRVDAVIEACMRMHPQIVLTARHRGFYQAIHQELTTLARTLEREFIAATERARQLEQQLDMLRRQNNPTWDNPAID